MKPWFPVLVFALDRDEPLALGVLGDEVRPRCVAEIQARIPSALGKLCGGVERAGGAGA
jgi:hypothetical protein